MFILLKIVYLNLTLISFGVKIGKIAEIGVKISQLDLTGFKISNSSAKNK